MRRLVVLLVASLALGVAQAAAIEIIIMGTTIEPPVLRVPTGARVEFINRTRRNVHVEFGADPRQHEVVQVPLTGPIWTVFHRPGTHPYVVHVWADRLPTTLAAADVWPGRRGRVH